MITTREAALEAALNDLLAEVGPMKPTAPLVAVVLAAKAAIAFPATEPQGYVEGPQFRSLKTCKGCAHFKSEYWREPYGDGETYDSGTSADCLKAGRSISTYHGSEPAPPDWCPLAARPAPQPAAEHEYPDPLIAEDRYEDDQPAADTRVVTQLKAISLALAKITGRDASDEAALDSLAAEIRSLRSLAGQVETP